MLKIDVLRADTESTAQMRKHCAICESVVELGSVYVQMNTGVGPDYLCERCLRGLCEFARREDLDVAWRDADRVYQDARNRYTEPQATHEEMLAMSAEEQLGVYAEAYLTPAPY